MREIIFRGKSTDDGKWVYGSFIPDLLEVYHGDKTMPGFIKPFGKTRKERMMVEVERDSVGQYTGLDDKNGKKIFEGDVVRYIDPDSQEFNPTEKYLVEWDEYTVCIMFECFVYGKSITYDLFDREQANNLEVIGNIHDDQEVLKS